MRRDVVAIAAGLFVIAGTTFFLGWQARPEEAEVRSASEMRQAIATAPAEPAGAHPVRATATGERRPTAIDRYLSDDRLFATFGELRQSTRGADLWVAHRIAFDCRLSMREDSLIGQVLAGLPFNHFEKTGPGTVAGAHSGEAGSLTVTQHIATPAQVAAARELRRRCDGFEALTLAAYRAASADLENRLLHTDDAVGLASGIALHQAPATPDRLRTILASRDPVAITLLDDELADRWQRAGGQSLVHALWGAPTPVMQLVACDLEADCSATSRTALLGCIDDADGCGLDVHRQLMRLETASAQQSIEDTRERYLQAIDSGNGAIWGL